MINLGFLTAAQLFITFPQNARSSVDLVTLELLRRAIWIRS